MMSNSKNYNSIVFLTTLSVYLGLVLVGAAPPIAAQVSDGEKKHQIVTDQASYGETVYALVVELEKLSAKNEFDWAETIELTYDFDDFKAGQPTGAVTSGEMPQNHIAFRSLWAAAYKISRELSALENSVTDRKAATVEPFEIKFSLDKSGITIKASRKIAAGFSNVFLDRLRRNFAERNETANVIYENTKLSNENSQVFIVTRLPRASIDRLLAAKND